ncbi:MAG: DUF4143 domain-containing protein [Clostridiales bacterium]|nr:DUF4143 domain-containing protein [Clostridiales bacterium]
MLLDEIQSSPYVFNGLREMIRNEKFKVIATGSYMGIMELENKFSLNHQEFFYPTGDVDELDLTVMSYQEVVDACADCNFNASIDEIYNFYLQCGGYPEVVKKWLSGGMKRDYTHCFRELRAIYRLYVKETQMYFEGPCPEEVWTDTLIGVAEALESGKDIADDSIEQLTYRFRHAGGVDINRAAVLDSLRWLLSCRLLFRGDVFNDLKSTKRSKKRYFFIDQGLMNLVLGSAAKRQVSSIDHEKGFGMLAENFVALCINEFTTLMSYSRSRNTQEEIDFIIKDKGGLVGIEVKAASGDTPSSNSALIRGDIKHIVKIQSKREESSEDVTVFSISHAHELGGLFGFKPRKNRYDDEISPLHPQFFEP